MQSPPAAYLNAAVAAIGEGSTHSGFFQQLTNQKNCEEPGLGDAVIGGLEPLLVDLRWLLLVDLRTNLVLFSVVCCRRPL